MPTTPDESRPWHRNGTPEGEMLHGTGYRDYIQGTMLRRYPGPRRTSRMCKLAQRCAGSFDTLRRMPHEHVARPRADPKPNETPLVWRGFTTDEAHHQAVEVLACFLAWVNKKTPGA